MQGRRIASSVAAFVFLLLFVSCTQVAEVALPLADLTTSEWNEIQGAEGTICADGSAYKYFAYKGTTNKLVIDFQGGGACWDALTCSSPYSNPNPAIGGTYINQVSVSLATEQAGIYDHANEENPVKDWYHVFLPYCTGDLHVGNNSKAYTPELTIEHKGAVNAKSVLDWTFSNFENPESIFVTGCSAGGYGSLYWTETIKTQYPDVPIYQMGDCAAGVSTDAFSQILDTNWNVKATFPNLTFDKDATPNTYISTANKFKDSLKMAQYNTALDSTQIGFFALATGNPQPTTEEAQAIAGTWANSMLQSLGTIDAATDNFSSFTAAGSKHCIITDNDFYTLEESGTKLVTWLTDYLAGTTTPNVIPTLPTSN